MSLSLSPEQKYAFEKFIQGENLFITGPGGTGKSYLIHLFIENMKRRLKNFQVCAMTGCAAVLLNCNARTLHSFSGIRLAKGTAQTIVDSLVKNMRLCRTWRTTDILIVDEVSMMTAKMFNIIELFARTSRKNTRPFGGMQVIFTGDFFQLPPVFDNTGEEEGRQFCFQSERWSAVFPHKNIIQLENIFRQRDSDFVKILNEIRIGNISEDSIELLNNRIGKTHISEDGFVPTKIFPIRSKVDNMNQQMFDNLDKEIYEYEIIKVSNTTRYLENGKPIEIKYLANRLQEEEVEREINTLIKNSQIQENIELKIGSVVMCTANIDVKSGICNGAQGVIIDFVEDLLVEDLPCQGFTFVPIVKFNNGVIRRMNAHFWQSEYHPTICVGQLPLMLAWAVTVHKIQGASMQYADMDIGNGIFEYGQTYVALSRIRNLDGLFISSFNPSKIKANPLVIEFYSKLPSVRSLMEKYPVMPRSYAELQEEIPAQKNTKRIAVRKSNISNYTPPTQSVGIPHIIKKLDAEPNTDTNTKSYTKSYTKSDTKSDTNNENPFEEYSNKTCCICMTNESNVLCLPCKHLVMCNGCNAINSIRNKKCPVCRNQVSETMNVFT